MTDNHFSISIGEPVPVLDKRAVYLGTLLNFNGQYYDTPVDFDGLARLADANSYHGAALKFKADRLIQFAKPTPLISQSDLKRLVVDWVLFKNVYLQKHVNGFGQIVRLSHLPAVYMRRAAKVDTNLWGQVDYYGEPDDNYIMIKSSYDPDPIRFMKDEVIHLKNYDPLQGIYGKAEYLGCIQDILLSEDATLFRRRWTLNGAHMGFILVTTNANINDEQEQIIKDTISQTKGLGNGKSIFLNITSNNAQRDNVRVIPMGNQGLKDDFKDIKEWSEPSLIAAHGIPPVLLNVIPANTSGLGDPIRALQVYYELGIIPLQNELLTLNELVGKQILFFVEPSWKLSNPTAVA